MKKKVLILLYSLTFTVLLAIAYNLLFNRLIGITTSEPILYKQKRGWIILPTNANGLDIDALFDTGAFPCAIDSTLAHQLGVTMLPLYVPINGKEWFRLGILRSLQLGGCEFRNIVVVVMPFPQRSSIKCASNFIVGMNVIRQLNWDFLLDNKTVALSRQTIRADNQHIRLTYRNRNVPKVFTCVNGYNHLLTLDFGYSGSAVNLSTDKIPQALHDSVYSDTGIVGTNIYGYRNEQSFSTFTNIVLTHDTLHNVNVSYSQFPDVLGISAITRYSRCVLNARQKEILLIGKKKSTASTKRFGLGFSLVWRYPHILIGSIANRSPAQNSGLSVGDTIQCINGIPTDSLLSGDYCSDTELMGIFQTNSRISLKVKDKELNIEAKMY